MVSHWFPVWFLDHYPERRVMLASYEADFAATWGRKVRNSIEENQEGLSVRVASDSSAAMRWDTTKGGGMTCAGVAGPMTGKGAHCLIIDDPVKNSEQAASPTYRDKAWEWWQSTAYTRIEPGGCCVLVMTRWHEDDLAGRILANMSDTGEHWDVLRLPALAESDDPLARPLDTPLWPERYDGAQLDKIRQMVGSYWWAAMYQQRPAPREGGMFKRQWFPIVDAVPSQAERVRYWDKAGTSGGGAYSAGVLMAMADDGIVYVEDVVRGQWSSGERNAVMLQTAQLDAERYQNRVHIWTEQEPGSGGKESAEATIRLLAGYPVHAETVTGAKEVRAEPFAAQAEAGNVRLVRGPWNYEYLDELAGFPTGTYKDMVDGSSGSFNKLARGGSLPFAWLRDDEETMATAKRMSRG
jgi:predicted phage terminase large subunit-like protein